MEKKYNGYVVGVLSGDRIILQGKAKEEDVPPSRELNFSFIEAPRMATPTRNGDPFALASREFVRKLLIGKLAYFVIDYKREDRQYATIWVEDPSTKKEIDVIAELIKEGLAEAKITHQEKEDESFDKTRYDELKEFQDEAKKGEKGKWTSDDNKIKENSVSILFPGMGGYDAEKVINTILSKESGKTEGIVEYVFSPTLINVLLVKYKIVVKVSLEYLMGLPGGAKATEAQQKLNKRAKAFLDKLIQHHDVIVKCSKYEGSSGTVHGRIETKDGKDVSQEVLVNGYSKLLIQTEEMDTKYYTTLRLALNKAQVDKKGFWKESSITASGKEEDKSSDKGIFTARVIEVHSGDSLTIQKIGSTEEKRVFLAGIRAPKLAPPTSPEKSQPYAWEAKEFLRKLVIGKQVTVEIEYTKVPKAEESKEKTTAPTAQKKPMTFVNIIVQPEKRVANVDVVENGLATVLTPRLDEKLTNYYQEINDALGKAKSTKKGIHSVGNPPIHSYQDLVGPQNQKTVAYYADLFNKNSHVSGVVEHCMSGSRFKVRIDEMNCYIPFICQGLLPLPQDPNIPELDEIFKKGQKFAKENLLQRDVKLDILSSDKKGNFFGILTASGKNYVLSLLEEGLAVINRQPGRGPTLKKEFYEQSEEKARKEKKGLWDPKANVSLELIMPVGGAIEPLEGKTKAEIVSFPSNRFFYAVRTDEAELEKIENVVAKSFNLSKSEKLIAPIRASTYCMALFSQDKKWYRGKIEKVLSETKCEVLFIDYGNVEEVLVENIRKIDTKLIKDYSPRAFKLSLAYLYLPRLDAEKGGKKFKDILREQIEEREVNVLYKYKEGDIIYAILQEGDDTDPMKSFNAYMLKKGWAKVSTNIKLPGAFKEWQDIQEKARLDQLGFWETDDLGENSDSEY